jgi:hypothetical protein
VKQPGEFAVTGGYPGWAYARRRRRIQGKDRPVRVMLAETFIAGQASSRVGIDNG